MKALVSRIKGLFDGFFPEGTAQRKLIGMLSVVLLFEGVSVLILFSKAGIYLGITSVLIGSLLLFLSFPREYSQISKMDSIGVRIIHGIAEVLGGTRIFSLFGIVIVIFVFLYNLRVSPNPALGDADTLSVLMGLCLVVYPFIPNRYQQEAAFVLFFIGFVVLFLVIPQALVSTTGGSGSSSVGDWYVHYMLAAPFAGILDVLGIPATSSGSMVTLEFRDGSVHLLSISAYCAGLYSFSIFLSAFLSFVLVFERLSRKMLVIVLGSGLIVAYLGNLLRMVIIGVIGYYNGIDDMLWAHENVGWMIFMSWSVVFWWLILSFTSKHSGASSAVSESG